MKVYTHLNQILTLEGALAKKGRNLQPTDLHLIEDGSVVFDHEKILWVGPTSGLPEEFLSISPINLKGHILTPEIVDSHTHTVFAGDRAKEYSDRINGISYEEIAKRGGGILFTMQETRNASQQELFDLAKNRIESIYSYGVGTIEIKSGYGLEFEKEYEIAHVIDRLKKYFYPRVQIFNTFLAAHDIPRNYPSSSQYMKQVVIPLLEKISSLKIIDAVDIFHEKNYFTGEDVSLLFSKAKALGIHRKIHADELNSNEGAELAVAFNALSADHLLKISDQGIADLASSETIATLLPGTAFFLGKPLAPARKMLDQGVRVAIASDFNPGSCHCDNVLMVASISAAQLKINQAELWAAITYNGAAALGLKNQGIIRPGYQARFSLFKATSLSHITYNWGKNLNVTLP